MATPITTALIPPPRTKASRISSTRWGRAITRSIIQPTTASTRRPEGPGGRPQHQGDAGAGGRGQGADDEREAEAGEGAGELVAAEAVGAERMSEAGRQVAGAEVGLRRRAGHAASRRRRSPGARSGWRRRSRWSGCGGRPEPGPAPAPVGRGDGSPMRQAWSRISGTRGSATRLGDVAEEVADVDEDGGGHHDAEQKGHVTPDAGRGRGLAQARVAEDGLGQDGAAEQLRQGGELQEQRRHRCVADQVVAHHAPSLLALGPGEHGRVAVQEGDDLLAGVEGDWPHADDGQGRRGQEEVVEPVEQPDRGWVGPDRPGAAHRRPLQGDGEGIEEEQADPERGGRGERVHPPPHRPVDPCTLPGAGQDAQGEAERPRQQPGHDHEGERGHEAGADDVGDRRVVDHRGPEVAPHRLARPPQQAAWERGRRVPIVARSAPAGRARCAGRRRPRRRRRDRRATPRPAGTRPPTPRPAAGRAVRPCPPASGRLPLATPGPGRDAGRDREAVTVGLDLGLVHVEAVVDVVGVVEVHQPGPRRVGLGREPTAFAVELGLLPEDGGLVGVGRTHGQVEVVVDDRAPVVAGVVVVDPGHGRVVQVEQLGLVVAAPAEEDGVGVHASLDVFPRLALDVDVDAGLADHVGRGQRQALAGGVGARVDQGEARRLAVQLHDPVAVGVLPPAVGQDLAGVGDIVVGHLRRRLEPRESVDGADGGAPEAVEHPFHQCRPVDRDVDRLADGEVRGDRVADRVALVGGLALGGGGRQHHPPVVDGVDGGEAHAGDGLGGQRLGNGRQVHVARFGQGEGGVLLGEEEHDPAEGRLLPVVVGVGLHDELLALVPAHHLVGPGADRVAAIGLVVGVLGDDAQGDEAVDEGALGPLQPQLDGVAVERRGRVEDGDVGEAARRRRPW